MKRIGMCILSALLMASGSFADELQKKESLDAIMEKSGINKQVEHFPGLIKVGIEMAQEQQKAFTDEELTDLIQKSADAFDYKVMLDDVYKFLEQKMYSYEILEVLEWLETPLGAKITEMEVNASSPEAYTDIMSNMTQLLVESSRLEDIKRLEMAINAVEASIQIQENVQVAIISALMSKVPIKARLGYQQRVMMARQGKEQLRDALGSQVLASLVYSYQDLRDEELLKYIEFYESDIGERYIDVTIKAIDHALTNASKNFGKQLGDHLIVQQEPIEMNNQTQ